MNENKAALLKIFSQVLKDRVKSEPQYQSISSELLKFFTRKQLIEIITHIYQDEECPWENNIVEMENEELLLLIKDDYAIISYITNQWSREATKLPTLKEWMDAKVLPNAENKEQEPSEATSKEELSELPKENATDVKSEEKKQEIKPVSGASPKKSTPEKPKNP